MRASLLGMIGLSSLALLAACDRNPDPRACTDLTMPGLVVQYPGLDVGIRDASGRGQALGSTVVVRPTGGTDSIVTAGRDTVRVLAGFLSAGRFDVAVHKPFYRDTVAANVLVSAGECGGVIATHLPITLRLVPGAPPVRSVGILGGEFLPVPTDKAQLVAVVDADAGLSTAVSWRSKDTTLATVDANGLVSARCTTVGGTDTVTATSVADTSVRGRHPVVVTKQISCP